MTLTARHMQTAIHEGGHCSAAMMLGCDVVLVSRRRNGEAEGMVLYRAKRLDGQVILIAPFIAGLGSTDFDPAHYRVDLERARALGDLDDAVAIARRVVQQPEFTRLAGRVSSRLLYQPILGREELEALR